MTRTGSAPWRYPATPFFGVVGYVVGCGSSEKKYIKQQVQLCVEVSVQG